MHEHNLPVESVVVVTASVGATVVVVSASLSSEDGEVVDVAAVVAALVKVVGTSASVCLEITVLDAPLVSSGVV